MTIETSWRKAASANPDIIFRSQKERLLYYETNMEGDRLPQPGYVGSAYSANGMVFIGQNPGPGAEEEAQYKYIKRLASSSNENLNACFRELNSLLSTEITRWKIYRYINLTLESCGISFDDVAYTNIFKWRTKEVKAPTLNLLRADWLSHTAEQVIALRPQLIVAIGIGVGKDTQRLLTEHNLKTELTVFRRTRGDVGAIPTETQQAIKRIAIQFRIGKLTFG